MQVYPLKLNHLRSCKSKRKITFSISNSFSASFNMLSDVTFIFNPRSDSIVQKIFRDPLPLYFSGSLDLICVTLNNSSPTRSRSQQAACRSKLLRTRVHAEVARNRSRKKSFLGIRNMSSESSSSLTYDGCVMWCGCKNVGVISFKLFLSAIAFVIVEPIETTFVILITHDFVLWKP